jgi:hypothetical protein
MLVLRCARNGDHCGREYGAARGLSTGWWVVAGGWWEGKSGRGGGWWETDGRLLGIRQTTARDARDDCPRSDRQVFVIRTASPGDPRVSCSRSGRGVLGMPLRSVRDPDGSVRDPDEECSRSGRGVFAIRTRSAREPMKPAPRAVKPVIARSRPVRTARQLPATSPLPSREVNRSFCDRRQLPTAHHPPAATHHPHPPPIRMPPP